MQTFNHNNDHQSFTKKDRFLLFGAGLVTLIAASIIGMAVIDTRPIGKTVDAMADSVTETVTEAVQEFVE